MEEIEINQTADISFRAFYKLGTEPLPLGLEKLNSKLIFQILTLAELTVRSARPVSKWKMSFEISFSSPLGTIFREISRNLWP